MSEWCSEVSGSSPVGQCNFGNSARTLEILTAKVHIGQLMFTVYLESRYSGTASTIYWENTEPKVKASSHTNNNSLGDFRPVKSSLLACL